MPLMPKRVKYRKSQRGSRKGTASRNLRIDFGEFGLQTLERAWITNTQLEAARVALTRNMKRKGKLWIRIFPDKSAKANRSTGSPRCDLVTFCLNWTACRNRSRESLCVLQRTNCRCARSFSHVITSGLLKNHENERDHRAQHGRAADQETRLTSGKPAPAFATAEWPA